MGLEKWLVDAKINFEGNPGLKQFSLMAFFSTYHPKVRDGTWKSWDQVPKDWSIGICFSLNCAWIEDRRKNPDLIDYTRLGENLLSIGNQHIALKEKRKTERARAQRELFASRSLKPCDPQYGAGSQLLDNFYRTDGIKELAPFALGEQKVGDWWQAIANWLTSPELRRKLNKDAPEASLREIQACVIEFYKNEQAQRTTGEGHAIALLRKGRSFRIFDMNNGEYIVPDADLVMFFREWNQLYRGEYSVCDVHLLEHT